MAPILAYICLMKNSVVKLLRWSERYTKTDMLYLAQGGFWLTLGQIITSGGALITSVAFANLLAPEVFGIYKYIISITSILTISTLAGMDSAVTQAVSRGFEGTLQKGLRTKMKWGLIGSALSFIVAIYYFSQGNSHLAIAFSTVALFMPFSESFDIYNALLFGKKLFHTQTVYNSIKKIFATGSIILALFLTQNILIIIFVYFASIVVPNIFLLYKTIRKHQNNNSVDPQAMGYGKKLSAIYIIGLITAEIDKILVFQYVGAAELAIYSLALAPTDQIKGLLKNVNALAMPQFSQKSMAEIKQSIWKKVRMLAVGTSIIVMGYVILAPIFFELLFPKYLSAIIYSQIIAISTIPIIIAGFLYTIFEAQKAEKSLYKYNTYSNILNILILFPLVFYFGIWGAVTTRLLTRGLTFIYATYLIRKI